LFSTIITSSNSVNKISVANKSSACVIDGLHICSWDFTFNNKNTICVFPGTKTSSERDELGASACAGEEMHI